MEELILAYEEGRLKDIKVTEGQNISNLVKNAIETRRLNCLRALLSNASNQEIESYIDIEEDEEVKNVLYSLLKYSEEDNEKLRSVLLGKFMRHRTEQVLSNYYSFDILDLTDDKLRIMRDYLRKNRITYS